MLIGNVKLTFELLAPQLQGWDVDKKESDYQQLQLEEKGILEEETTK